MAIVHEEAQTGSAGASTTVATSTNLTAVTGHAYLAAISVRGNIAVSSVAGLGLTWTLVAGQCSGRGSTNCYLFRAQGTVTVDGVVTATLASTPLNSVISVSRYSGAHASAPFGNVIKGNTNGVDGACTGGTDSAAYTFDITTTVDAAFVYAAAGIRNRAHTAGASYTERSDLQTGTGGDIAGLATEDRTVSSASTVAANGTLSGVTDWAVVAVELKPASADDLMAQIVM